MKIYIKKSSKLSVAPKYYNLEATKATPRFRIISYRKVNIILKGDFKPFHFTKRIKFYFTAKQTKPNFTNHKTQVINWVREVILRQPIYYQYFSRDCDCVEVSGYSVAKGRKAFNESEQAMAEGAEGTCWMKRCSKLEYEQYGEVRHTRDRGMEGFENGSNYYL